MKQNILKLLTEAALIVFSVLLALWIERKNKESSDHQLRNDLVDRVYADIKTDSAEYEKYIRRRDLIYGKINTLIQYASSKTLTSDSLTSLLIYVEWHINYLPSNSTYQSIVSSGQLQLFEQDTLFMHIISYYSYHEMRMVLLAKDHLEAIDAYLSPYLNSYYDRRLMVEEFRQEANVIDMKKFTGTEFLNIILYLRDGLRNKEELMVHSKQHTDLLHQIRIRKQRQ